MLRITDLVDSYRDLLASSRDAYLSMVSNRLNSISKQLTIVATIVLPFPFVTGFFGQNFKWMTDHTQSFASFAILGIGGPCSSVGRCSSGSGAAATSKNATPSSAPR